MGFDAVEIAVEDPALIDAEAVKKGLQQYGFAGGGLWCIWPYPRSYQ